MQMAANGNRRVALFVAIGIGARGAGGALATFSGMLAHGE